MSIAGAGARYLVVVVGALAARRAVHAYQQRHRRLDGTSADHWAVAVRPPAAPLGADPPSDRPSDRPDQGAPG